MWEPYLKTWDLNTTFSQHSVRFREYSTTNFVTCVCVCCVCVCCVCVCCVCVCVLCVCAGKNLDDFLEERLPHT